MLDVYDDDEKFRFVLTSLLKCYLTFILSEPIKVCVLVQTDWTVQQQHDKVKVKVTLVQALRLCTGRMAHTGSRGVALLFHDHGTRRG